jgi:hypothetical protein
MGTSVSPCMEAIKQRDPACPSYTHAFLFFKGFQGLQEGAYTRLLQSST